VKGRKVAKHCVFPMTCGSRGPKSRLAKAAGAEPSGQMRDEKLHTVAARSTIRSKNVQHTNVGALLEDEMLKTCTPLWHEAHFEVKMHKTHQVRNTFGNWALHSTFDPWRKSRRVASFLMLSTSKIEEVSQNSFVFDIVKFEKWGSLADLLCFGCCQVQKLRKSRRIAALSSLQIDR